MNQRAGLTTIQVAENRLKLENLCSLIDMHIHVGSTFDNRVAFTSDLLSLGSIHAEWLPNTVCLLMVPIAHAVDTQTDRQTHTQQKLHRCHWLLYPQLGYPPTWVTNGFEFKVLSKSNYSQG